MIENTTKPLQQLKLFIKWMQHFQILALQPITSGNFLSNNPEFIQTQSYDN